MMDALEFFKARKRMCEAKNCGSCKLYHVQGGCCLTPEYEKIEAFEEAIAVVEQWAKDNPSKTRQSEFLKHYPGARITIDGFLHACPMDVFSDTGINCAAQNCIECKKAFWSAEVDDGSAD